MAEFVHIRPKDGLKQPSTFRVYIKAKKHIQNETHQKQTKKETGSFLIKHVEYETRCGFSFWFPTPDFHFDVKREHYTTTSNTTVVLLCYS